MDAVEEKIVAPAGVDANLYTMVLTALRDSPKTRNLTEEQLAQISELAILEGKFNDEVWLHDKIKLAEDDSPHIPGSKILKIPVNQPASIERQADLDEIIAKHQEWMDSVLHPTKPNKGGRANLKGADLSEMNLEEVDLRGANLKGANLSGVKASGANLTTCNLEGANLEGAFLEAAKLRRCNFENANLSKANFNRADLRRVVFNDGTLWDEAVLSDVKADEELFKGLEKIAKRKAAAAARAEAKAKGQEVPEEDGSEELENNESLEAQSLDSTEVVDKQPEADEPIEEDMDFDLSGEVDIQMDLDI